jgi:hypothetical protein
MWAAFVAALLTAAACAPAVDGPIEKQIALDRADSARLTAQLAALPGVVRAEVILHRPARDPLSVAPPAPGTSSIVLIVDDATDRGRTEASAISLSRALAPDIEPTLVVEVGATRAKLAKVGPFTVEAASKPALKGALAIALAVIALLAGWVAWSFRSRLRQ